MSLLTKLKERKLNKSLAAKVVLSVLVAGTMLPSSAGAAVVSDYFNGTKEKPKNGGYVEGNSLIINNSADTVIDLKKDGYIGWRPDRNYEESYIGDRHTILNGGTYVTANVYDYDKVFAAAITSHLGNNTLTINSGVHLKGDDVYGGRAGKQAERNSVTISGTDIEIERSVCGGETWTSGDHRTANNNTVTIAGGEIGGSVYGGKSIEGENKENRVVISGTASIKGDVYGACTDTPNTSGNIRVENNTATINGGRIEGSVYGGYSHSDGSTTVVTKNVVTIDGGYFSGKHKKDGKAYIVGGFANRGEAFENKVIINGANDGIGSDAIYGGVSLSGTAKNNSVVIEEKAPDGEVYINENSDIAGGYAGGGHVEKNTVTLNSGTVGNVMGGKSEFTTYVHRDEGRVANNVAYINGGAAQIVAGGQANHGEVTGNKVYVNGGTVNKEIRGGYNECDHKFVYDNEVTIAGGEIKGDVYGGRNVGGYNAQVNYNTVKITDGTFNNSNAKIVGGASDMASVQRNTVIITGQSKIANSVYGGYNEKGHVYSNQVIVGDKDVHPPVFVYGDIFGGYSKESTVDNGTVTIYSGTLGNVTGGKTDSGLANISKVYLDAVTVSGAYVNTVIGGQADSGAVADSTVVIKGGTVHKDIMGGFSNSASKALNLNKVTIEGGRIEGSVYGGRNDNAESKASVENNTVLINGGMFVAEYKDGGNGTNAYIAGGRSKAANVTSNKVTINKNDETSIDHIIYGGYSTKGEVTKNEVLVEKKADSDRIHIVADIYGGYSENGNASNNTVTINSDKVFRNVYGGVSKTGEALKNTINLGGTFKDVDTPVWKASQMNLSNTALIGGSGSKVSGNTLNVFAEKSTVQSIKGFDNINFYLNKNVVDGDTMLKVADSADITNATINAQIELGTSIDENDKIVLLDVGKTLIDGGVTPGILTDGLLSVPITLKQDGKQYQMIIDTKPSGVADEAKSPVETQSAILSVLNMGNDLLAGAGFENAAKAVAGEIAGGASASTMTPYMAMGGNKTRIKSGSHVDVKGWNLNVGLAKELANKAGKLLIGPVVEYGRGSYDSYLDNGQHGDGKARFVGGGVMAKQSNNSGVYYEGSLRVGRTSTDYKGELAGKAVNYDSKATYYAAHVGLGKVAKLGEKTSLDYYGKLFYTHQGGDQAELSSGVDYDFDSTKSLRSRLGARLTQEVNDKNSWYVGMAWQHEFKGESKATVATFGAGVASPAPSVKGNTGIFELGWNTDASKNMTLGLGMTGSVGKQKGVGFNLNLDFKF